eukprot:gene11543-34256_t
MTQSKSNGTRKCTEETLDGNGSGEPAIATGLGSEALLPEDLITLCNAHSLESRRIDSEPSGCRW